MVLKRDLQANLPAQAVETNPVEASVHAQARIDSDAFADLTLDASLNAQACPR